MLLLFFYFALVVVVVVFVVRLVAWIGFWFQKFCFVICVSLVFVRSFQLWLYVCVESCVCKKS